MTYLFKITYKNFYATPGNISLENNRYKECYKIYKDDEHICNKIMSINSDNNTYIKQYLIDLHNGKIKNIEKIIKDHDNYYNKDQYKIYKNNKLVSTFYIDK